jgi:hypothetical protein
VCTYICDQSPESAFGSLFTVFVGVWPELLDL